MDRRTLPAVTLLALAAALATAAATPPAGAAVQRAEARERFATLYDVSAASATDAWSVGFGQVDGGSTLGLTRHWDGARWKAVPNPHPLQYSFLWGVEDLSPTDAWAVGESIGDAMVLPLAEHWNGSEWQVVDMRGAPGLGRLNAVAATGADDVWAVGTANDTARQAPRGFVMHWDGSRLHRVGAGRLAEARASDLVGLTAVAPDDVWAVGAHGRHGQTYLPLVEHYDGTRWSVVVSQDDEGRRTDLAGIDAASSDDVWTVGWQVAVDQTTISTLARHWDGSTWSDSPSIAAGYASSFTSVSAVAADDVWAVGSWVRSEQDRRSRPLIEHWDGQAWSIVKAPASGGSTSIQSIDMSGPTSGLAVGETDTDSSRTPYRIEWDGLAWSR